MRNPFREAEFVLGAGQLDQLPEDTGAEIAFAGRSNAGKSSALNALCERRALARVGRTPGRTQEINVFRLPPTGRRRLVDLPGYGYAKVSARQRAHWDRLIGDYLRERRSLAGLVLIMDIRHPLTPLDETLLHWLAGQPRTLHVVLTKADKVSRSEADRQLQATRRGLEARGLEATLQTFSALKRKGVDDLRGLLLDWLDAADPEGQTTGAHRAPD
ncbi:GTP-binding protein EngB [Thioalkalivibrio nitratireducens DSM 14787]|uniref:Probable GTP-binding protein EngB n=1 Tax=Thioalkalivibrio nitratireducens (strain DSM 14787 / UNIQEM 213 / ALEN2) TaxID=1255043 RepID=L0E2B6_THIND|nr:ribosome biogenesis GTP-binding protein YihA/YsxC [Thioalkalivibrio nitratireducens]AGA35372.1 GTP-binding protein EngB [Thioalkalivibrio nitratireducens DSM 14787]